MGIKKILCLILSFIFIIGSISIIYANNDINNDIKIITKFDIDYNEETNEQLPLFDITVEENISYDGICLPESIKGYINDELIDIPVVTWEILEDNNYNIPEEYTCYIPIFDEKQYQILNDIDIPYGIIKFIQTNEDCNCDLSENLNSLVSLSSDPVKGSNTVNKNIYVPDSYYNELNTYTLEHYEQGPSNYNGGNSNGNMNRLVWVPNDYATEVAKGYKYNVIMLLHGWSNSNPDTEYSWLTAGRQIYNGNAENYGKTIKGSNLFAHLMEEGRIPHHTIVVSINNCHRYNGELTTADIIMEQFRWIFTHYNTYVTCTENESLDSIATKMSKTPCNFALIGFSEGATHIGRFFRKYAGAVNNYFIFSLVTTDYPTENELQTAINKYGKPKNLIMGAGYNDHYGAGYNDEPHSGWLVCTNHFNILKNYADNSIFYEYTNAAHEWDVWFSTTYWGTDDDCMTDNNPSLYIIKESATPELLSKYPLTGAEFSVYTTQEAANTANNNLIAGRPAGTVGIAKDISGNNAILTVPNGSTDGKTNTIKIASGTYWVVETKAPNNYTRNTEVKKIVVPNSNTSASVKFTNEIQKGRLFIKKVIEGTSEISPIGLTFTVYTDKACTKVAKMFDSNNNLINAKLTITEKSTSGDYWVSNSITLPVGTYYVSEDELPSDSPFIMVQSDTDTQPINITSGTIKSKTFTNKVKTGKIFIKKMIEGTTEYEPIGCKFTIYKNEDCTEIAKDINGNNAILEIVRKEEGQNYWVSNTVELYAGNYYVKEEEVPFPFILDKTKINNFKITGNVDIISTSFTNKSKTGYIIGLKESDITNSEVLLNYPLIGTEFTVYTSRVAADTANNNLINGRPAGTEGIAKDIDGNNVILKVTEESESKYGKGYTQKVAVIASNNEDDVIMTYYVVETKTPVNYERNTEVKEVTVKTSDTETKPIKFTYKNNVKTNNVTIVKVSKDGAIYPLTGIQFTIYTDEACTKVAKDIHGNDVILTVKKVGNEYKTDIFTLPVGVYYGKETYIPEESPYKLDTEVFDIDLTEQDQIIIRENEINKILFKIQKVSTQPNLIDKFPIIGTQFTIYTSENAANIALRNLENGLEAGTEDIAKDIYGNNAILTVIDNDGYTNEVILLLSGEYWVVETYTPEHYKPSIDKIQIQLPLEDELTDSPIILKFTNILQVGKGKVNKTW